jgi:hypothetical protein
MFKAKCRDLYCTKCQTVQGFTLVTVTGYKHYWCNKCDKFTVMEFTGPPYNRDAQGKRVEQVLDMDQEATQ